jgi:aspartyl aminopeptidase
MPPITAAQGLCDFINSSWTHFHATQECCKLLSAAGFQRLHERDQWKLQAGGKYFLTRNGSSVVAFVLGGRFAAGHGFNVVAAHTDRYNTRLLTCVECTSSYTRRTLAERESRFLGACAARASS